MTTNNMKYTLITALLLCLCSIVFIYSNTNKAKQNNTDCNYQYDTNKLSIKYSKGKNNYIIATQYGGALVYLPFSKHIVDGRYYNAETFDDSCKAKSFIRQYTEQQYEYK